MADFQLKVTAETQRAEKDLQRLDRTVNEATKERKLRIDIGELNKNFSNVEKNIKEAGNAVQSFYRVSKNIPGIGERVKEFESLAKGTVEIAKNAPASAAALRENAKAGSILTNSLQTAGGAATTLIDALARTGLAIFAVKEAVGVLSGVFGGFFNETIGREIKLRETILKTQTTLASTSKVFRNGQEITDPYGKIVSLTGEVRKNIDSIRVRSLELAGVTSNDVIEVFGIVAQQVNQIGGGLKEAEDLAIQFSAALGTFGLPLYQARQEIGSILRGEITEDSYLAKSLLISSKDIEKAKTQAGGVVKFLEERLSAAVAGQKIAAQGFAGITSNIREIAELTTQAFGAGLLDPLLGGLTNVYTLLFRIAKQLQAIAKTAGTGLGQILANSLTVISGNSALLGGLGNATEGLANQLKAAAESAFQSLATDTASTLAPIQNIFEEVLKSVAVLAQGLSNLAVGFASIQIENFKALVQVFSNLTEGATIFAAGLGTVLSAYGSLLQVPFVQYLSQISAQFKLLEAIGVKSAIQLAAVALTVLANWKPVVAFFQVQFGRAVVAAGAVVAGLGAAFSQIAAVIAAFAATLAAAIPGSEALQASLTKLSASLRTTGASATEAGAKLTSMAGASGAAASKLGSVVFNLIKFNLIILAVTGAITILIDLFGRWQRAKDKEVSDSRAEKSLALLATRYKNVGDNADAATKAAKNFHEAVVNARYQRAISEVEQLSQKLAELEEDMNRPVRWALDGWFKNWALNRIPEIKKQLENALKDRDKWARTDERSNTEEDIRIGAQNRVNLEKEIGDLRRQIDSDIFQQRQALAQKEIEIFRAAGELRIFQMEQANAKLIEGEEGASAAALESLNNYLSTRERGELDIEAAKKSLVIEVANLEKEISNYRLENEKKIAEIRKRAGDYDKKIADYQRQAAGATGPAITDGFRVGNTGRSTGPHLDIRSPVGDSQKVIDEAVQIIKAWQAMGVAYIQLSNTKRDVKGINLESELRAALAEEQRVHGKRSGGGAIDIAVPEGTVVPRRTGTPSWDSGGGGWMATSLDSGNIFLHGQAASKASVTAGQAPVAQPTHQGFDDIGAPAVQRYADAVRGVASALERARALQEALTNAKTAAAFDEIAKAAFPKVNVEQYRDQLIEAEVTLKALAETAGDAYDPEALKLSVDKITKRKIQEREISEILTKAKEQRKAGKLSEAELNKLKDSIKTKQAEYLQQLEKERKLRQQVLEITRQQQAVEDLRAATQKIGFDLQRSRVQGTAAMGEAFAGDDPVLRRRAEAEALIAQKRIELEEKYGKNSAQAQEELRKFAASTRAAAGELAKIDKEVADFQKAMAMIREGAKTITEGFKGFVKTILTGGNIQEAMVTMLESVADKFLNMALDAAFKPLEDMLAQNFKDFFGIEDPTQALQAENNAALTANTAALNSVAAALGGAGAAAGGPVPLPVEPYQPGQSEGDAATPSAANEAAAESAQQAADATNKQADANKKAAESAKGAGDGMAKFGQVLGSLAGIAAGAGAIAGGIGMMQKGGTYNTLMGLAGVFGGIGGIAGGFTGFFRASGGPVSANRPYIVGEKGPELFSPSGNGTIISNQALFSANRGAMGTGSTGGGDPFSENRSAISSSQAALERRTETERMQRATANPSPIDIRYEAQVINNVEYVTTDQFRSGLNQAAERGRALAYNGIQNSTKVRSRLGI